MLLWFLPCSRALLSTVPNAELFTLREIARKSREVMRNLSTTQKINKGLSRYDKQKMKVKSEKEAVFGIHPVRSALTAGCRTNFYSLHVMDSLFKEHSNSTSFAQKQTLVHSILQTAADQKIPVLPTSRSNLDRMTNRALHQGLCLMADRLQYDALTTKDLLDKISSQASGRPKLWLLLDSIGDPMNLGAILRAAAFFGVDGVFCGPECSRLTPVVSKASSGVIEYTTVYQVDRPAHFIQMLREHKWDVIGTVCESGDPRSIKSSALPASVSRDSILIVGNEGFGMDQNLTDLCTKLVNITQRSVTEHAAHIDSLNVSMATGIILHQLSQAMVSSGDLVDS